MEEIVKLFFSRPLKEVIMLTGFRYNRIISIVENYCILNNIDYKDILSNKIKEFSKDMLEEYENSSLTGLSNKYKINKNNLIVLLKEYCEKNGLDYIEITSDKADKLDKKEIYELKLNGKRFKEIAEKFECSESLIRCVLKEYCEENNIDYEKLVPKMYNSYGINEQEIYELKSEGKTFGEIAQIYGCSVSIIYQKIKKYCELRGLNYDDILLKNCCSMKDDLDVEYLCEQRAQGKTYKELVEQFNCTQSTIFRKIFNYCYKNGLNYEEFIKELNYKSFTERQKIKYKKK